MSIADNLQEIKKVLPPGVTLVAVSKTYPVENILEAYNAGQRIFGENKVQEVCDKEPLLPKDIEWHVIGHLQTNKVKYIAPFVSLIHSADSLKLLAEINKQAEKNKRIIDCLLQVHIASEETKFGLDIREAESLLLSSQLDPFKNICIRGLMGMATNTADESVIRKEFASLNELFQKITGSFRYPEFNILSMGMSSDYKIAVNEGSTMIRVGSRIFGSRN